MEKNTRFVVFKAFIAVVFEDSYQKCNGRFFAFLEDSIVDNISNYGRKPATFE